MASLRRQKSERVKYSERETKLLSIIPRNGRQITVADMMEKYWNGEKKSDRPFYARASVMSTLRMLRQKVVVNREPFVINVSRLGKSPKWSVWIETRKQRAS